MGTLDPNIQFSTPNKYNFEYKMKTNEQALTDNKPSSSIPLNDKIIMVSNTIQASESVGQSTIKNVNSPNTENSVQTENQVKCSLFEAKLKEAFPPSKNSTTHLHVLDCCNCKKSKCLKLYCECFRNGRYCVRDCLCIECRNLKEYENLRLKAVLKISARNPMAFKPKIDKLSNLVGDSINKQDGDSDKAIHTRGCNCKKSKCLLKYCECYQNGVPCTDFCKCCNCHNTKDDHGLNCYKIKESVARETTYGSKKHRKHKHYDKSRSSLVKRDELEFGYEAIDIKSDLKYAKIGTSAYTECQDAIFQSESEESNKHVLRTSKYENYAKDLRIIGKKSSDKGITREEEAALFLKNQLILNSTINFAEFGSDENYCFSNNEISKLISKNRDVLLS